MKFTYYFTQYPPPETLAPATPFHFSTVPPPWWYGKRLTTHFHVGNGSRVDPFFMSSSVQQQHISGQNNFDDVDVIVNEVFCVMNEISMHDCIFTYLNY
jgi:hypothetical protein